MTVIAIRSTPTLGVPEALADRGLGGIFRAAAISRLAGVAFLGALHPLARRHEHSRLDHSVGVAALTGAVLGRVGLPPMVVLHGMAAGLLHDACQWPLSHTAERVFRDITGYGNGQLISAMMYDDPDVPAEFRLSAQLSAARLDRDVLFWGLLRGHSRIPADAGWRPAVDLVSGPINPDTLDGITRAAALTGESCPHPAEIAATFELRHDRLGVRAASVPLLDEFWRAKSRIYERHIHSAEAMAHEAAVAARVRRALGPSLTMGRVLRLTDAQVWSAMASQPVTTGRTDATSADRFRPPRRYVIDDATACPADWMPLPDLRTRYRAVGA